MTDSICGPALPISLWGQQMHQCERFPLPHTLAAGKWQRKTYTAKHSTCHSMSGMVTRPRLLDCARYFHFGEGYFILTFNFSTLQKGKTCAHTWPCLGSRSLKPHRYPGPTVFLDKVFFCNGVLHKQPFLNPTAPRLVGTRRHPVLWTRVGFHRSDPWSGCMRASACVCVYLHA